MPFNRTALDCLRSSVDVKQRILQWKKELYETFQTEASFNLGGMSFALL